MNMFYSFNPRKWLSLQGDLLFIMSIAGCRWVMEDVVRCRDRLSPNLVHSPSDLQLQWREYIFYQTNTRKDWKMAWTFISSMGRSTMLLFKLVYTVKVCLKDSPRYWLKSVSTIGLPEAFIQVCLYHRSVFDIQVCLYRTSVFYIQVHLYHRSVWDIQVRLYHRSAWGIYSSLPVP